MEAPENMIIISHPLFIYLFFSFGTCSSLAVILSLLLLEFSCESVNRSVPTQPLVLISSADSGDDDDDDDVAAQLALCQGRASGKTPLLTYLSFCLQV